MMFFFVVSSCWCVMCVTLRSLNEDKLFSLWRLDSNWIDIFLCCFLLNEKKSLMKKQHTTHTLPLLMLSHTHQYSTNLLTARYSLCECDGGLITTVTETDSFFKIQTLHFLLRLKQQLNIWNVEKTWLMKWFSLSLSCHRIFSIFRCFSMIFFFSSHFNLKGLKSILTFNFLKALTYFMYKHKSLKIPFFTKYSKMTSSTSIILKAEREKIPKISIFNHMWNTKYKIFDKVYF